MENKILIVYYTHSGNTRKVAEAIAAQTGGKLCEITPKTKYPEEYKAVVSQAKIEIRSAFMPEINDVEINIGEFDTIFVGSPNWCGTVAPPIAKFLSQSDFSGKTIAPFCTNGGGGTGHIEKVIRKLCLGSNVASCFSIYNNVLKENELNVWLNTLPLESRK